jgi:signal transduction histidine kinase
MPYVVEELTDYLDALPALLAGQQAIASLSSLVSVPLLLNDRPLGFLEVGYSHARSFSEEDLAFLHALGQEAALAIRSARLYEREREQVARLRALDELQRGFVSAVSHELRTPLTCIKTSVDLLDATTDGLAEDQVELIRTIGHHVGRLETFVIDLLEITKLEAGQITLSRQPTDLRFLIDRVVEAFRPLTDRKDQTVLVEWPEGLDQVEVDRRRIEQVLTNILSNAIKFSPKGAQITIRASGTPACLQVCTTDTGPGIAQEDLERVFDRFYVVADGRGLSGVGLGLYIARQMVELHGGRIWVDSRAGEGCTFCFALPWTAEEGQP